ncbi:hypothetical protein N9N67_07415 [Bacteriovoracaceae bacterium]|nr:hypothetical protein [Bacteriovoracaceae bacterium]
MKLVFLLSLFMFSAIAHDGGHGPALKDESSYGGKVSAIIDSKEVNLGRKAKMLFKAELVHNSKKNEVKVYLYDQNMKAIDLKMFENKMEAVQIEGKKEKKFSLKLDKSGKFFVGKRPKNKRVPFNIDIMLKKEEPTLFGAFDGLD